jgi:hypothetical protein
MKPPARAPNERKRTMRRVFPVAFALAVAVALGLATWGADNGTSATAAATTTTAATQAAGTKLRIRTGRQTLTATVARNATARDFLSLLPLSLRMRDFLAQEKTAPLPRALASGGTPRFRFSAGDIALWPPGPDVVVYYRRGAVPDPGIVLLARLDSNPRAFSVPGTVRVRMERVR